LPGVNPGAGQRGGRLGRRHHHRAGSRRRRSFGDDARYDGSHAGGGRCRRTDPGGRLGRYRRWPRACGGTRLGGGRYFNGHPLHRLARVVVGQAMKEAALSAGGDQTEQTRVFDIVRGSPTAGDLSRHGVAQRLLRSLAWSGGRAGSRSADPEEGLFGHGGQRFCNPRRLGRRKCRSGQGYPRRLGDHRAHHRPGGRGADRRSPADTPLARGANHALGARFEGQPSTHLRTRV